MKYIGNALKLLFSFYGLLFFSVTLLIATLLYAIVLAFAVKNADIIAHKYISRNWANIVLNGLFIKLIITGKENLNENQNYIFISNHRSMLDIPVCTLATSLPFKFLSKQELTKIPLFGWIIKQLYITVSRGSSRDRVKSMAKMKEAVLQGNSVWIYPEGTRNKTEKALKKFEDGAFWLAIETQKPIAAFIVYDTAKILKAGSLTGLSPGKLIACWEKPISTEGLTKNDLPELKQKFFDLMEKRFLEFQNK